MHWTDSGVILSVRKFGESGAIIEVFSRAHGRYLGLVHGGNSRRLRPLIQVGNEVQAHWRARLAEQLGVFTLELITPYAAHAMASPLQLAGVEALCALLRITPERHAYMRLYDLLCLVLTHLDDADLWPALCAKFELALLAETGFGLDLSQCAASGARANLHYVSPRSGRAVSRAAAQPYIDKLFRLPAFLLHDDISASRDDMIDALSLTGYFLTHRLFAANDFAFPPARDRLLARLKDKNYT